MKPLVVDGSWAVQGADCMQQALVNRWTPCVVSAERHREWPHAVRLLKQAAHLTEPCKVRYDVKATTTALFFELYGFRVAACGTLTDDWQMLRHEVGQPPCWCPSKRQLGSDCIWARREHKHKQKHANEQTAMLTGDKSFEEKAEKKKNFISSFASYSWSLLLFNCNLVKVCHSSLLFLFFSCTLSSSAMAVPNTEEERRRQKETETAIACTMHSFSKTFKSKEQQKATTLLTCEKLLTEQGRHEVCTVERWHALGSSWSSAMRSLLMQNFAVRTRTWHYSSQRGQGHDITQTVHDIIQCWTWHHTVHGIIQCWPLSKGESVLAVWSTSFKWNLRV